MGTGGALFALKPSENNTIIINGDILSNINLTSFVEAHLQSKADITVASKVYEMQVPYGVLKTGEDGFINDIEEKPSKKFFVNRIDVVSGDVRDYHFVKSAMQGCDAVLHLAALIAIPYSYHAPESYVDTNIKGTLNIVQAARELSTDKIIHTSTSETYGTAQYVPIDEKHPLHGQSPYSASKIGADQMAISYHRSFETPVTVIRPFNTYGPRQSNRAVIPTVITQLANGTGKVKLGALTPTRDFTFVEDTVSGFITALNTDGIEGDVINIGSGFEISIEDTAKKIARIMGKEISFICEEARVRPENSEVNRLFASIDKAKEVMNCEPVFNGNEKKYLNECIETTFVSSVGKFVDQFEQRICDITEAKYAVAVVNGTCGLQIASSC